MSALASVVGLPQLAKYELVEEIGHGGMATVYRARDPRLGREVAVKLIHKHLRENTEVATRFVAEARAAAKLRHPGIVEVYDVSAPEDGERYLVVELLRGTTLRKILQSHRDMPAEVGASIVLSLCEALDHAHEAGIIHRDVKPENVLVELPSDRALRACSVSALPANDKTPRPAPSHPLSLEESGPVPHEARELSESEHAGAPGVAFDSLTGGAVAGTTAGAAESGKTGGSGGGAPAGESAISEPVQGQAHKKKGARGADLGVVIKLTDFGIAKVLDAQGVTSTGQVLGSPAHMAPEQIEGGDIDPRTDVFALGVLMYECLVGHLPFEGKNPAQVLRKVLDGIYSPADRERPTVGGRWSRILAAALARDAASRTPTPAALGEAIQAELEALGIQNPRAEIAAYFNDPAGYSAELTARLVPRLVARGESARRAGDIPGAAADYNRALALAPNDLSILKRISSLTSSANRRLFARRAGAVAASSLVLGVAAFGVARLLKPQRGGPAEVSVASAVLAPFSQRPDRLRDPRADTSGHPVRPPSSTDPDTARPRPRPLVVGPSSSAAAASPRRVQFSIIPKGAKLTLDGQPVSWFGVIFTLPPGPHAVGVTVPGSKCCKPYTGSQTVLPSQPAKPDEVQTIVIRLDTLPATVTLVGAPANAQYSCPSISLSGFTGATKSINLPEPLWTGRCEFKPPSGDTTVRIASVTLKAGESNAIPWPAE